MGWWAKHGHPATTGKAGMRTAWDSRAQVDALYHVDSTQDRWTVEAFYARGSVIVAEVVDPVLARFDVTPRGKGVLDVGCGVGRFFPGLAQRFDAVSGIDVSPEMITRGQALCPVRASWFVGDGRTLAPIDDSSVDHVVSFEMLQHVPDGTVIESYLAETMRVLKAGGTFQLQLRAGSDSIRQAVMRRLPRVIRHSLFAALRQTRVHHVEGDVDTWFGTIVPPARAKAYASELGFSGVEVLPDELHSPGMGYWLVGRKP